MLSRRGPLLDFSWVRGPQPVFPVKRSRDDSGAASSCSPAPDSQLNLLGGIPSSAMPGERSRRWGQALVDADTFAATEALLLDGRPGAAAQLSMFGELLLRCEGLEIASVDGRLREPARTRSDLRCPHEGGWRSPVRGSR